MRAVSRKAEGVSGLTPPDLRFTTIAILCFAVFFNSCAIFPKKPLPIQWPDSIDYMAAICELDMSWRDMKYSGSMSLQVDYPDKLLVEVYGPFGNTVMYLKKDKDGFLLESQDTKGTEENKFEKEFGIRLSDFIDDITMKGPREADEKGKSLVRRRGYTVVYELNNTENSVCWQGNDGHICIKFLEVSFDKGKGPGKSTPPDM